MALGRSTGRGAVAGALLLAGTGLAHCAHAQEAATAASGATPSETGDVQSGVEEIVVTARRRSENLQDTPVAITAVSGSMLADRQATSITALNDLAPSLTINSSAAFSGSSQTVAVFMRGIGQTDFTLNTEPGVGIYVDGVYISRSVGALLDLVDIDRIEVLRGPQGTLFGRNSVGGALNITTQKPTSEFGGKASLTYGTDNLLIATGTINVPLTDTLFVKASLQSNTQDGYVERIADGIKLGNKDNLSGRLSLLWNAGANTEIQLNADFSRSRENGAPLVLSEVAPGAPFAAAHNIIVAPQLNPALQAFPNGCLDPAGAAIGGNACFDNRWVLADPFKNAGTYPVFSDADVWGLGLTIKHELSDALSIKSITAYRDLDSKFSRESDGSPLQINSTEDIFQYHQFSQEIQLSAEMLDGGLNVIAGGFYFDEKGHNPNIVDFGFVRFLSGGDIHNSSVAGFGQATYKISQQLALTAGIRYTSETKRFTPDQFVISGYTVPFFPPFLQFTPGQRLTTSDQQVVKAKEWTPHFNLSFRPTDDAMLYVSYSRGFKSGGFTQRIFPALTAPPSFQPETVDVYEGGFKLDLFDRRFRLNGAGFLTDYSDLQVTVPVGVAPTTQNAAQARIKGFELEATAVPIDGLTATFAVGYVDAYYLALDTRVSPTITLDSKFPGTSDWTLNGSLQYAAPIGKGLTLTPLIGWSYRSEFSFDAENFVGQGGYHLVDASIKLANTETGWSALVFGKNLTDELYYSHGEQILNPGGFKQVSPARGRQIGLTLAKEF